jgi:tight adherence protein B
MSHFTSATMLPLIYVFAFVSIVMIGQAASSLFLNKGEQRRRVNRRLDLLDKGMSRDEVFETLVRTKPKGTLATAAPKLYESLALYFRQAGMAMSPQRFLVIVIIIAVGMAFSAAFAIEFFTRGAHAINIGMSMAGGAVLAFIGGALWVSSARKRRLKRLEEQLPIALDITVRALRAGHPLVMAIKLAADEMADPIGSEFGLVVDETTYGLEFRDALQNFAHRTGSEYVHFFAVSVSIQSETGGNLAEILGNLCSVIRGALTLHLRVAALASEGKTSAMVLSLLPVGLIAFIMMTQPEFYTSKMDDPIFWPSVGVVGCIYLFGQWVINRMVNFKY